MSHKYTHLSLEERVKIEVFLDHGASLAGAARCIGRHRSTVTREVQRAAVNGLDRYIAHFGQRAYAQGRKLAGRKRRKLGVSVQQTRLESPALDEHDGVHQTTRWTPWPTPSAPPGDATAMI